MFLACDGSTKYFRATSTDMTCQSLGWNIIKTVQECESAIDSLGFDHDNGRYVTTNNDLNAGCSVKIVNSNNGLHFNNNLESTGTHHMVEAICVCDAFSNFCFFVLEPKIFFAHYLPSLCSLKEAINS